jgi:hypothetical protein
MFWPVLKDLISDGKILESALQLPAGQLVDGLEHPGLGQGQDLV